MEYSYLPVLPVPGTFAPLSSTRLAAPRGARQELPTLSSSWQSVRERAPSPTAKSVRSPPPSHPHLLPFQHPRRPFDSTPTTREAPSAFAWLDIAAHTSSSRAMTPPGRPPKRPGNPSETPSPEGNPKVKLSRVDRGPEDFSSVVKNKVSTYTRTGQACDRCKVRRGRPHPPAWLGFWPMLT